MRGLAELESAGTLLPSGILDAPDRLFDLLPIAVCVCDLENRIVRYNRRAAELWGHRPTCDDPVVRFCGSSRLYAIDGSPIAHAGSPMAEVLQTGIPVHDREIVIERPDGGRRVVLANIEALEDELGQRIGAVGYFHDISVEHPQEQLSGSEMHAHDLLAALPAPVYTTDAAGHITFYNEAAALAWGQRPELGKSKFCGSWKMFWPDGRPLPHDECPMALALKERRPIDAQEIVIERPDGQRVSCVAYPTPLFSRSGELVGAVNMFIDIADLRRAEHDAQHLAAIVESSDDAILSKDLNGIIESWNRGAQRLFGYRAEEVIGKPVTIIIPTDRLQEETEILSRIRRGERIDHYETIRRRKDGSLVEISLTVSPLRNGHGNIVGASKIARDITERRRAQEQQQLLLREMNHRIRNLFALSSGVVTLSARSATTLPELVKAVRERLGALARAHALTLTDVNGGGNRAERATTMYTLVQAILSPFDNEKDANDRVSISGPDIEIAEASVTSLALLLHEFATNAAKYGALSTPDGRIIVECLESEDEYLLIWNERGGPPIDQQVGNEGFGTLLARTTVEGHLAGRLEREWNREGLTIRLTVPRDRLQREDPISPEAA